MVAEIPHICDYIHDLQAAIVTDLPGSPETFPENLVILALIKNIQAVNQNQVAQVIGRCHIQQLLEGVEGVHPQGKE